MISLHQTVDKCKRDHDDGDGVDLVKWVGNPHNNQS